jgi:hypothetical protein
VTDEEALAEVIGKARWLDGKVPTDKYLAEQIVLSDWFMDRLDRAYYEGMDRD